MTALEGMKALGGMSGLPVGGFGVDHGQRSMKVTQTRWCHG